MRYGRFIMSFANLYGTARAHACKVASELRKEGAQGLEKGIIFLPGEPTRLFEESDQGPSFRQRR